MKNKIIIILLLFAISGLAYAIPPDVNFTFTPTNPRANQSILFNPNVTDNGTINVLKWQFDTDGNVNTYGGTTTGFILNKIFDLNLDGWTTSVGTWSIAGGVAQSGSVDSAQYATITWGDNNSVFNVNTRMRTTIGAGNAGFTWNEPNTDNVYDSYGVKFISSTGNLIFVRGGVTVGTITTGLAGGTWYDINAIRASDGNYSFYVNGTYATSFVDTTTPISNSNFVLIYDDASTSQMEVSKSIITYISNVAPNSDTNQTHTFTSQGNKNVCYMVGNQDGNTTTCNIVNVSGFDVNISVFDENTGAQVTTDLNVVVNGTQASVSDNNFTIDENDTFPMTIVVNATGYDQRQFYYETLTGLIENSILGMRDSDEASDIDFQFYGPDETTLLTNRIIQVYRNNYLSGRQKTDALGRATFNLAPQDNIYDFNIFYSNTDYGDANIEYTYQAVTVTVNNPKNELTGVDINTGFNIDVGGLGLQNIVNQSIFPFSTIYILGNTEDVYTIRVVDFNGDGQQYFARNYLMQTTGDTNTLTITPYLIGINDGILVNLITKDNSTSQTISNIRLQLLLGIGGNNVVVEDQLTDVAGVAQFVMQSQKSYRINVTSPNQSINYFTGTNYIVASSTSFTIWINYADTNYLIDPENTSVSFSPNINIITSSSQVFDINATTTADFNFIHLEILDYNKVIAGTICSSSPCNSSFNVSLTSLDTNVIIARAVFVVNDTNFYQNKTYYAKPFATDVYNRIVSVRNDLSPTSLILIMFVIVFALLGYMGSSIVGNNISQVFVVGLAFALMYYLWITDLTLWMGFFGAVFGVALLYIWSRNKGGV